MNRLGRGGDTSCSGDGSNSIRQLRHRVEVFDQNLKDLELRSRSLKDFLSGVSEGSGERLARLSKRHTRHLIPPQHTPSKNGKLLLLERTAITHPKASAVDSVASKRYIKRVITRYYTVFIDRKGHS